MIYTIEKEMEWLDDELVIECCMGTETVYR